MSLIIIGISHKTAPIHVREKFHLSSTQQDLLLSKLKLRLEVLGAVVISTCNRVEIYLHLLKENLDVSFVLEELFKIKKQELKSCQDYFYQMQDKGAIEHLFKVIVGLDSLVLGEKQIIGQVKEAFEVASNAGSLTGNLNLLNRLAIRTAKIAHSETDIGYGGTSVSWAAVNFAEKYLENLDGKEVLVLGSGHMGELAVKRLVKSSLKKLYIMNRTRQKALVLAEKFQAEPVSFFELTKLLEKVDLCICAVDAPHYVIEKEAVESFPKKRSSELLLIDISMPRNIDPTISNLDNIALFFIDDLGSTLEKSYQRRKLAVKDVESIIQQKIKEFDLKSKKMQNVRNGELTYSSDSPKLIEENV
ncbi:glutamyl-tRNA reductase [PVC group bacterium (ex Bugula neritina AB1)]|nr:glutamyl-tRNA reductase [PVC group bacterium (ex Bugula neritina AB1)]